MNQSGSRNSQRRRIMSLSFLQRKITEQVNNLGCEFHQHHVETDDLKPSAPIMIHGSSIPVVRCEIPISFHNMSFRNEIHFEDKWGTINFSETFIGGKFFFKGEVFKLLFLNETIISAISIIDSSIGSKRESNSGGLFIIGCRIVKDLKIVNSVISTLSISKTVIEGSLDLSSISELTEIVLDNVKVYGQIILPKCGKFEPLCSQLKNLYPTAKFA